MSDLTFVQLPTGRTHQVHGIYEDILGVDGEPETEWALCAIVDGHRVPLQTFTDGYVAHMVGRADTAVDASSSSSTTAPETAKADTAELDAANARIAELEQQLADAQAAAPPVPPAPE